MKAPRANGWDGTTRCLGRSERALVTFSAACKPHYGNDVPVNFCQSQREESQDLPSFAVYFTSHKRNVGETGEETGLMLTSCTVGWDIKKSLLTSGASPG